MTAIKLFTGVDESVFARIWAQNIAKYDTENYDILLYVHWLTDNLEKYTVNHKKGGRTFVIITLENLDGFL